MKLQFCCNKEGPIPKLILVATIIIDALIELTACACKAMLIILIAVFLLRTFPFFHNIVKTEIVKMFTAQEDNNE